MIDRDLTRRVRLGILIGSHIGLGLVMGLLAFAYAGRDWPMWIEIWFIGLVSSEMLLLGIWLGFASTRWWLRVLGMIAGIGWMTVLAVAPDPYRAQFQPGEELIWILASPMLIVACACLTCRQWLARIERQDEWPALPTSNELQFTLRSIVGLTATISVLLALGRFTREIDEGRGGIVITLLTISLTALLAGTMLIWACLGPGRVVVRIPIALVGMAAVGLIFPYYVGGPEWRFLVWPALTLVVSAYVVSSLLVVRNCGYRLVPKWQKASSEFEQAG